MIIHSAFRILSLSPIAGRFEICPYKPWKL